MISCRLTISGPHDLMMLEKAVTDYCDREMKSLMQYDRDKDAGTTLTRVRWITAFKDTYLKRIKTCREYLNKPEPQKLPENMVGTTTNPDF